MVLLLVIVMTMFGGPKTTSGWFKREPVRGVDRHFVKP